MKLCIKKAVKRLYGLRVLKKAGMSTGDLPGQPSLNTKKYVRKCPKTSHASNFSRFSNEDALHLAGLDPLYVRRVDSCKSFVIKAKKVLRVIYSPNVVEYDRNLRSGNKTVYPTLGRLARLNNFVTVKYQC